MDPSTWKRVADVFYEAVELEPDEWPAFVAEACGSDADLRREVETLLAHHRREGTLFRAPLRSLATFASSGAAEDVTGRAFGRYTVEREVGSGGMGRVFLAHRADLPKRVALKVVREPLASPDRVRRFEVEQRVLARLEHPHIAQLVDAGITADGTPYFAMEYVEGEPLTVYCDRRRRSVADRLRLVLDVCSAVRYAHAHLVIHRDIKPSNILVTEDGRVKLLDFGVAKLLTEEGDHGFTRTSTRVFTPNYSAPEQLTGQAASTATDVYQLGAVLYELLVGGPPLEVAGRTLSEAERIVLGTDPPAPSAAVARGAFRREAADGANTAWDVSERRSVSPHRLRAMLRGDLDNIVLKALEKEPAHRYTSVDALAADIEHYLAGEPVSARPGTPIYRLRKLLLRNKVAAGVAIAVIGYAVTATLGGLEIARERDRAEREAATARRVSDFLVEVFTRADPADTVPGQATAMELVERGVRQVDQELASEPATRAAMQEALARVYHGFGREAEAETLLRDALATRLELFGEGSLEAASARHGLAQVLWAKGELEAADTLESRVLEVRRALLPEDDESLWVSIVDLGTVRHLQGDLPAAERLMREGIALVRRASPEGHVELGGYLSNLANVRFSAGDYDEARALMEEALESDRRFLPADHPSIALRLDNLAYMALRGGSYDVARERAEEALAMYWRVYGAPHPDMPYAISTIAGASLALGDTAVADSMHLAAADLRLSLLGPDDPNLYLSQRDLGRHFLATGRPAQAEPHLEEALRIAEATRGLDHEWYASAIWELGRMHRDFGDARGAIERLERALELHVAVLGEEHPQVASERDYLVAYLRELGRDEEADAVDAEAGESDEDR